MQLLLDSHVALWWLSDPEKLSIEAREEGLTLVTRDGLIKEYQAPILKA